MYLDWLATAEFHHGLSPMVENHYLAVVAIDGFPAESWPGILNSARPDAADLSLVEPLHLPRRSGSAPEARAHSQEMAAEGRPFFDQLFQTQSRSVDQDAMMMVAETEDAIAQASSQLVAYGYYTPVIVLFDDDEARLREKAEAVRRLIQAEGFGARIETVNATEAFLGSLPGNWYANIREPLINTRNLADLIPLNSVWSGGGEAPCPFYPPASPPLMQVASGSTPFRLNLHVDDVGHTLIFGPTGSGKSTLLALIAAQFRRYAFAQVFAFDKGRSMLPLTLAAGGDHYEIGGETEGEGGPRLLPARRARDGRGSGLGERNGSRRWSAAGRADHAGSSQRHLPADRLMANAAAARSPTSCPACRCARSRKRCITTRSTGRWGSSSTPRGRPVARRFPDASRSSS
jgi:type IV secretory pathway VirB4 component